ncbi:phosphoglycerate kinase [candidate division WWE3 bacterium]|nr:phosphoglycerate kinase [candidate division WWE3 bacterium]
MESLKSAPIQKGTRVFVRCDLDVPVSEGKVNEVFRLSNLIPTLKLIIQKGGRPIIVGHMGRPEGIFREALSTMQLRPFFDSTLGESNYELLQNLRFDSREEKNDIEFAKELIEKTKCTLYVNESFANSHRKHTSMIELPKLLPHFAGLRLCEELSILSKVLKNPKRPLIAVIGGVKLDSKKPAIKKFLEIADGVLVGGRIGLDWDELIPPNLFLPVDYAEGNKDLGEKTLAHFSKILQSARTIVWAGPMGLFEDQNYRHGTKVIAQNVALSSSFTIVGGGDTIAALKKVGYLEKMDFVSTGGGAMLEFLIQGNLPALEALGYHG